MSPSLCWTAQRSAVVPSASAAFTSACLAISARTAAVSPFLAAVTIGEGAAANAPTDSARNATDRADFIITVSFLDTGQRFQLYRARAVAELVDIDADFFEQRQVQVVHRRVFREPQMAPALQRAGAAADEHERQIDV